MVEDNQTEYQFEIDKEKSMLSGVAPQQIAYTMNMALSSRAITNLYDEDAVNQVGIILTLDEKDKSTITDISQLKVKSRQGNMVPIGDLVTINEITSARNIYRKNQKRVVYVLADMAGELESPAYAILGMEEKLKTINLPQGYEINELYLGQPDFEDNYTVKWDGEWQITLEVFRDLGIAFLGAIILIYILDMIELLLP